MALHHVGTPLSSIVVLRSRSWASTTRNLTFSHTSRQHPATRTDTGSVLPTGLSTTPERKGGSPLQRNSLGPPLSPAKHTPRTGSPTKGSPTKGGSPGRRHSLGGQMDRHHSLSTLAPVLEEPAVLPASIAESLSGGMSAAAAADATKAAAAADAAAPIKPATMTSGIRMTSSLDWLQGQTGR